VVNPNRKLCAIQHCSSPGISALGHHQLRFVNGGATACRGSSVSRQPQPCKTNNLDCLISFSDRELMRCRRKRGSRDSSR
jgi:hypothetical protein